MRSRSTATRESPREATETQRSKKWKLINCHWINFFKRNSVSHIWLKSLNCNQLKGWRWHTYSSVNIGSVTGVDQNRWRRTMIPGMKETQMKAAEDGVGRRVFSFQHSATVPCDAKQSTYPQFSFWTISELAFPWSWTVHFSKCFTLRNMKLSPFFLFKYIWSTLPRQDCHIPCLHLHIAIFAS